MDLEGDKDETEKEKKDESQGSTFEEAEVKDGEEGTKGSTQISTETKLKKVEENPRKNIDYSLIDSLCSFVDTDDELLPILCGYFHKIMGQLLQKQKTLFLEYLLLERKGALFHGLLKHIEHHSIALLLIALLETNIVPETSKKTKQRVSWDIREESDSDGNEETCEAELTSSQKRMKEVLSEQGKMVVSHLLDCLGPKNQDDIHKALNASTVLQEFVDNEHCFPILTEKSSLNKLVWICSQTETNRQNLPYALSLLSTIINQFIEHEKSFQYDKKEEFFKIFAHYFTDLVYNCLIILRQHDASMQEPYVNQTGHTYLKIGVHRIRAIE